MSIVAWLGRAAMMAGFCALMSMSCSGSGAATSATTDSTGTGTSSTGSSGGGVCPQGYTICDRICCPSGTTCSNGECKYPYTTAKLVVYLCPSFNSGNCSSKFFSLENTCNPIQGAVAGSCYVTDFDLNAGRSYGLASCVECGTNCSNPASFSTPKAGFPAPQYYPGISFYCGTPCTAPPDCGGSDTTGTTAGTGGGSTGTGGTGAGGSGPGPFDGGGSIGSDAGFCSASSPFAACSPSVTCARCSFQACACADPGGSCSSGYKTSDGSYFGCDGCGSCTNAAQSVSAHCGC